jgi:hypothetical protein
VKGKVRQFHGLEEREGKKGQEKREGSAAADLQQAGIHTHAGLPAAQELALVFGRQGTYKQGQERGQENSGDLKESHFGREERNGLGIDSLALKESSPRFWPLTLLAVPLAKPSHRAASCAGFVVWPIVWHRPSRG